MMHITPLNFKENSHWPYVVAYPLSPNYLIIIDLETIKKRLIVRHALSCSFFFFNSFSVFAQLLLMVRLPETHDACAICSHQCQEGRELSFSTKGKLTWLIPALCVNQ